MKRESAAFGRLLLGFLALTCGCRVGTTPSYQVHRLSSGKEIRVLGVAPLTFRTGGKALILRYLTDISVEHELPRLHAEVNEIWHDFRGDVERGNFTTGVISAIEKPRGAGFFASSKGYNFAFGKQADGTWKPLGRP
jgi:hypothetical protein